MAMFAVIVAVAPVWIAGLQKPWMAKINHILVTWFPAIHAGMTASMSVQLLTRGLYPFKIGKENS
jgi:hypothetical protein